MRYVDEFREPQAAVALISRIRRKATRRWVLMEVCGGQTHSLLRYGIDSELQDVVEMIHGPGCPVCVTNGHLIDTAIQLAGTPGVTVTTFGDMLRVPGSGASLASASAQGASVVSVYSPIDAVHLAQQNPLQQIVFFAVGFETTAPSTALAILQAQKLGLKNFSMLTAHVQVIPAMTLLAKDSDCRVQAFLAAGHVCSVTGYECYHQFAEQFQVPIAVTGFEPIDLLKGICACIDQLEAGTSRVENVYSRAVMETGNSTARRLVAEVFEECDQEWRGMGLVPEGGLKLRGEFQVFDAMDRFQIASASQCGDFDQRCRAGDVLTGKLRPCDCPEFRKHCTPDSPLGAPMVSSEGACAAWFHFGTRNGSESGC